MMKIITPSSWEKHPDGFEAGLRQWELDIAEFEKASGDILNDMVKYAIMMNQAPKSLKVQLVVGGYVDATALKGALIAWCYNTRSWSTSSAPQPTSQEPQAMEVDAISRMGKYGK